MNLLALFDIDNTLIQSSTGHVQALLEAIKEVYGLQTSINVINHHGMTDQEIITGILEKCDVDEKTIRSNLKTCAECFKILRCDLRYVCNKSVEILRYSWLFSKI